MPAPLPKAAQELLSKPVLAHFVTLMKDGSPQVTPVWVDTDGTNVLVNTAEGRVKSRNVRRDPRVALSVVDSQNAWYTVQICGRVVEVRTKGADAHIDKLAKKYLGKEKYPFRAPGEVRLTLVVQPERVAVSSG